MRNDGYHHNNKKERHYAVIQKRLARPYSTATRHITLKIATTPSHAARAKTQSSES
jgi:hypothetical protein